MAAKPAPVEEVKADNPPAPTEPPIDPPAAPPEVTPVESAVIPQGSALFTLKAPEGATGVSVQGVEYLVQDGEVHVPQEVIDSLINFGYTVVA